MRAIPILIALAWCARAESLDAIFARMDKAAKDFKAASANLHETQYTAVIQETSEENGQLHVKRVKGGMKLRVDFSKPNERVVALGGHTLEIYYPNANTENRYDVSKYTSTNTVEQLLLLSFGAASGAELRKDYEVSSGGTQVVDGKTTTLLQLVPKSESMRKVISRITLWIPEGEARALKEKVDKGRDYTEWTYSNVDVKDPVPDSEVTLKVPANTHVVDSK